jgi:hypothetical protein
MAIRSVRFTDYFAGYPRHEEITAEIRANATVLLDRVNGLLTAAVAGGVLLEVNDKTKTLVSRTRNGGWRPSDCTEGTSNSSHRYGQGIDIYDPYDGDLDAWIDDEILIKFSLYREHPSQTKGWVHLSTRSPHSGKRTFYA